MPDGMDWGEMETVGDLADEEKRYGLALRYYDALQVVRQIRNQMMQSGKAAKMKKMQNRKLTNEKYAKKPR